MMQKTFSLWLPLLVIMIVLGVLFAVSQKSQGEVSWGTLVSKNDLSRVQLFELKKETADNFNRNFVRFPPETNLTAADLIAHDGIMMVRYFDENEGKYVSFVALRQGVGKNFQITPDHVYELFVSRNVNLTISLR